MTLFLVLVAAWNFGPNFEGGNPGDGNYRGETLDALASASTGTWIFLGPGYLYGVVLQSTVNI